MSDACFNEPVNVAFIGHGFVGAAMNYLFSGNVKKMIVDPLFQRTYPDYKLGAFEKTGKLLHTYDVSVSGYIPSEGIGFYSSFSVGEVTDLVDFQPCAIVVSVPTPMAEDGSLDGSIVLGVLEEIRNLFGDSGTPPLVIIKSTMTPSLLEKAWSVYPVIVYNPEFLTEARSLQDALEPPFHIFGSKNAMLSDYAESLYRRYTQACFAVSVFHADFRLAALTKLAINAFLATKVVFFNELREMFPTDEAYADLKKILDNEPRVGRSHSAVPGPDGKYGTGGKCFPKDMNALNDEANKEGKTLLVLESAILVNEVIRGNEVKPAIRQEQ